MSYKDLCIQLLTNPNSPFKGHVWSNFSFSGIFYDLVNMLACIIARLFKIALDGMNSFAIGAYRFLSFSESETIRSLYDLLAKYIWIPVLLCGTIACIRIVIGDIIKKNVGKQFIRNICYLFIVVAVLPSVFSYLNKDVFGGYQKNGSDSKYVDTTLFTGTVKGKDDSSLADSILRDNTIDRVWLYNKMVQTNNLTDLDTTVSKFDGGKTVDSINGAISFAQIASSLSPGGSTVIAGQATDELTDALNSNENLYYGDEMLSDSPVSEGELTEIFKRLKSPSVHEEWINSGLANNLTLSDDTTIKERITENIKNNWNEASSDNSGYIEGIPNLFKMKVNHITQTDSTSTKNTAYLTQLSDGTDLLGIVDGTNLGKESYWRYDIDWLSLYIEMLAHAYVFFVVGYCAIKLIIELIVHQVFGGIMAAMDLSGGDRIKKYLTSIIGCYIGLLLGIMVIPIYRAGCEFITHNLGVDSGFIRAVLKIVLAMVIVNIPNIIAMYFGVNTGAGAGSFAALAGAGVAMSLGRTAGRAVGGIKNSAQKWHHIGHQRSREHLQDKRFEFGHRSNGDRGSGRNQIGFNGRNDGIGEAPNINTLDNSNERGDNTTGKATDIGNTSGNTSDVNNSIENTNGINSDFGDHSAATTSDVNNLPSEENIGDGNSIRNNNNTDIPPETHQKSSTGSEGSARSATHSADVSNSNNNPATNISHNNTSGTRNNASETHETVTKSDNVVHREDYSESSTTAGSIHSTDNTSRERINNGNNIGGNTSSKPMNKPDPPVKRNNKNLKY